MERLPEATSINSCHISASGSDLCMLSQRIKPYFCRIAAKILGTPSKQEGRKKEGSKMQECGNWSIVITHTILCWNLWHTPVFLMWKCDINAHAQKYIRDQPSKMMNVGEVGGCMGSIITYHVLHACWWKLLCLPFAGVTMHIMQPRATSSRHAHTRTRRPFTAALLALGVLSIFPAPYAAFGIIHVFHICFQLLSSAACCVCLDDVNHRWCHHVFSTYMWGEAIRICGMTHSHDWFDSYSALQSVRHNAHPDRCMHMLFNPPCPAHHIFAPTPCLPSHLLTTTSAPWGFSSNPKVRGGDGGWGGLSGLLKK